MIQLVLVGLLGCGWLEDRVGDSLDLGLDLDRAQVERLCRAAKKLPADQRRGAADSLDELIAEVAQDQLGKPGVALLKALDKMPVKARREAVDTVLRHNGLEGLDCPPLERILFR
ncbi:MAG: hypothetical protein R3F59_07800 [Myxococcota bacterium]